MNLASDASSLGQHGAELRLHPSTRSRNTSHANITSASRQRRKTSRSDRNMASVKTESGAGFVPNTIVVTGDYAKRVRPGRRFV